MKPEEKKEQELSSEDLEQTTGGLKPIVRLGGELSTADLDNVSGGAVKKQPPKAIDSITED